MPHDAFKDTFHLTVHAEQEKGILPVRFHGVGQGGIRKEAVLAPLGKRFKETETMVLRLFVQEYYQMCLDHDRYDWSTLDASIASIRECGAEPLLALCMKPHALYPLIDERIVHPNDYDAWQRFIEAMVTHYNRELGWHITYWEIFNEPDIGELGGCPGLFEPTDYYIYYQKTVEAILRADPHVKVGGPALANASSPILPALLAYCVQNDVRIDFVSWHIYTESPQVMIRTIQHVQSELNKYPQLHCENILDEWNIPHWGEIGNRAGHMLEEHPTLRCAHILAMLKIFCELGLDRSNYYHIKDVSFSREQFTPWFSEQGIREMEEHWNSKSHVWALFDREDHPRPHFYAYKLFQSMNGTWLETTGSRLGDDLQILAVKQGETVKLLLWNYHFEAPQEVSGHIRVAGLRSGVQYSASLAILDATTVAEVLARDEVVAREVQLGYCDGEFDIPLRALPFGVYVVELIPSTN
jgi:xylan 1,4-beta-xylosidase